MKIYLATTFGDKTSDFRINAMSVARILRINCGHEVYCPWEHEIPHAWDYPNNEWALMVFTNDVTAIKEADVVVMLSYGRMGNAAGSNWEAGYAFGIGKRVVVIEMAENAVMSLMVANGRYATIPFDDEAIQNYFMYEYEDMPEYRTLTEQK